jgi:pilus assembly protein Flp/PilA
MTTALIRRLKPSAEGGATAVEYALMVGLIALVIIAAVTLLGTNLSSFFTNAAASI